jgi:hypothetical protein
LADHNSSNVRLRSAGHGSHDDDEDEWEFEAALQHVMKQNPKQRAALFALHVGRSFSFVRHQGNPLDPEVDDAHIVCNAIDAKAMNKALRDRFDAADYFAGASKTIAIAALKECDPNYNVSGLSAMKKAEIATAAADQAISYGWLPPELRIKGYDGPGSKAAKPKPTIGGRIVSALKEFAMAIPQRNSQALLVIKADRIASEIDAAIADAFKVGFEHACAGGQEAGRKMPQLKNAMPLVLYVADDQTRRELIELFKETHPHSIEARIPEET